MTIPIKPLDLSDSANYIIKDVGKPLAQNIGTTLADCWLLVFGDISQAAAKRRMKYAKELEEFHEELYSKVNKIPPEKVIEPDFQTETQALEASKYCISVPELRHMFSSLAANAMNEDMIDFISPTFPNILRQMSSYDAKLFNFLRKFQCRPLVDYVEKDEQGSRTICSNITIAQEPFLNFELQSISLSSLSLLGLVTISYSKFASGIIDSYYDLEHNAYFEALKNKYKNSDTVVLPERGICSLTPLGKAFAKVCLDPEQFPPLFS